MYVANNNNTREWDGLLFPGEISRLSKPDRIHILGIVIVKVRV